MNEHDAPHDDPHDDPHEPMETDPQSEHPQTESGPQPASSAALAQSFASGHNQAQAQAQGIAELCLIAGQSQRTAEFLAAGLSEAQVRRTLLNARAEQPEIASRITADAGTSPRPENSPVVAAVKKLNAKE